VPTHRGLFFLLVDNMQILGFTIGDVDGDIQIFQENFNGDMNAITLVYEEIDLFIKCLKSVVNDG